MAKILELKLEQHYPIPKAFFMDYAPSENCCNDDSFNMICVNERPKARQSAEIIADYLLANGVIAPPCKVGDTVWFNTFKKNATICVGVQPHTIDRIDVSFVCDTKNLIETKIPDWEIGKTVFLTKEEAEKALERSKK